MSDLITKVIYDNPSNFAFNSNKIEIVGSKAKLKLIDNENQHFTEDFADDTGFTYDSAKAEFTAGLVRQVYKSPTDSILGITYTSSLNANWSLNNLSLTSVLTGVPVINANRIDVTGGTNRSARYENNDIGLLANTGAVKLKYTPNYTGAPSTNRNIFEISDPLNNNNRIFLMHGSTGALRITLYSSAGALILSAYSIVGFSTVSGQEYEIELNWNASTGSAFKVFVDGIGTSIPVPPYTRTGTATQLYVGAGATYKTADSYISDVVLFSTVQHTANYTKGYSLNEAKYLESKVDLPNFPYSGVGFIQSVDNETIVESGVPHYIINGMYYNGASWVASNGSYVQSNDKATMIANITSLPAIGTSVVTFSVVFGDTNTLSSVDSLDIEYTGQIYPTDNPTITINAPFFITDLVAMSAVENKAGLDELKYVMKFQGLFYYMVGDVVTVSDGTYAQSSSLAEIQAVLAVAPIDITPDSAVQLVTFLHSENGTTTPDIEEVTLDYNYFVVTTDPNTCILYGAVYDNSGNPVAGAKIIVDSDDFFYNENLISRKTVSYTNTAGKFSFKIVETATVAKTVDITVEYKQDGKPKKVKYTKVTIPNQPTAALGSLIP